MTSLLSIVVPTRDGAPYALVLADEYRRKGLRPLYLVDDRSSADYLRAIQRHARSVATLPTAPGQDFLEAMVPQITAAIDTKWLFRFDDDEFPSPALIDWLDQAVASTERLVVAVPRRAVGIVDGEPVVANTIPQLLPRDDQYRGFIVDSARFDPTLHSPGLEFDNRDALYAPEHCCLYHFDWVVRDRSQRAAKLRRYEALAPGSWDNFKFQYLPEDFSAELYGFGPLPSTDVDIGRIARRLMAARRRGRAVSAFRPWSLAPWLRRR